MITINYKEIDWKSDGLDVIRAKQKLQAHQDFLMSVGSTDNPRAYVYTQRCIFELKEFIYQSALNNII